MAQPLDSADDARGSAEARAAGDARAEPSLELTIDELAARTGITVRTLRFYAAEGLLPAPVRRGRIAYYSQAHLMRADFIRQMQEFGYTLARIQHYLERIPEGASPAEFAVHRALLAPWEPQPAEEMSTAELQRRAGRRLSDQDLELLAALGVLSPASQPDTVRVTASMLAMGVQLLGLPVPIDVLREAAAVIEQHAVAVADGLSEVFRRGIWEPFRQGDLPEVDQTQLAVVVSRLRPLAVQGLVTAFERAADRAIS